MKSPLWLKSFFNKFSLGRGLWHVARNFYISHIALSPAERLQKYGVEAIREIHRLLSDARYPYFADYGTLLGIVRDNGFIKHDDDIDFSVPPDAPSPVKYFEALSKSQKLVFCNGFEYQGRITELTYSFKGIPVDLFFSVIEDGTIYNYAYEYVHNSPDWIPYREMRRVNGCYKARLFKGCKVIIPENFDEILTTKYGTWRVPLDFAAVGRNVVTKGLVPREYTKGFARRVDARRIKQIG